MHGSVKEQMVPCLEISQTKHALHAVAKLEQVKATAAGLPTKKFQHLETSKEYLGTN